MLPRQFTRCIFNGLWQCQRSLTFVKFQTNTYSLDLQRHYSKDGEKCDDKDPKKGMSEQSESACCISYKPDVCDPSKEVPEKPKPKKAQHMNRLDRRRLHEKRKLEKKESKVEKKDPCAKWKEIFAMNETNRKKAKEDREASIQAQINAQKKGSNTKASVKKCEAKETKALCKEMENMDCKERSAIGEVANCIANSIKKACQKKVDSLKEKQPAAGTSCKEEDSKKTTKEYEKAKSKCEKGKKDSKMKDNSAESKNKKDCKKKGDSKTKDDLKWKEDSKKKDDCKKNEKSEVKKKGESKKKQKEELKRKCAKISDSISKKEKEHAEKCKKEALNSKEDNPIEVDIVKGKKGKISCQMEKSGKLGGKNKSKDYKIDIIGILKMCKRENLTQECRKLAKKETNSNCDRNKSDDDE